MKVSHCRICGNSRNNRDFYVKEMMFGYQDIFRYFQCSNCECLQITEFPKNIAKYYPSNYHSSMPEQSQPRTGHSIKRFLRLKRDEAALLKKRGFGRVLQNIFPWDKDRIAAVNEILDFGQLARRNICFNTKILDVGCGQGFFLNNLHSIGFNKLTGIDPFIEREVFYNNGIKIFKKWIHDIDEVFGLIVFNHSFEHMPDPLEVLRSVSRILHKKGMCRIRIPIVPSYAWEKYGVNWVQLDAPRHFFLHSIKSIQILTEKAGLQLEATIYDSTALQFWGSEQYLRNIPLRSSSSHWVSPENSIFSPQDIKVFQDRASELNQKKQGDQAAFYISKDN